MPTLNCPLCRTGVDVADDRLSRPVFCQSCGACLWQPPANMATPIAAAVAAPAPVATLSRAPDPPPRPPADVVRLEPPCDWVPVPRRPVRDYSTENEPTRQDSSFGVLIAALVALGAAFAIAVAVAVWRIPKTPPQPIAQRPDKSPGPVAPGPVAPGPVNPLADVPPIGPRRPPPATPQGDQPKVPTPPPTMAKEGAKWDLDALCGYLHRVGLEFNVANRVPHIYWLTHDREQIVMIQQCDSAADAKATLKSEPPKTGNARVWGRFLFFGDDTAFYRAIKAALP